ncbi:hypothetical protein BS17DRAFT_76512 [Gyrodon lividus]|nr:hypothetical protein BS17DRAFT_76512 [Gyrodon lividus]
MKPRLDMGQTGVVNCGERSCRSSITDGPWTSCWDFQPEGKNRKIASERSCSCGDKVEECREMSRSSPGRCASPSLQCRLFERVGDVVERISRVARWMLVGFRQLGEIEFKGATEGVGRMEKRWRRKSVGRVDGGQSKTGSHIVFFASLP